MIVVDHGKVFVSESFRASCAFLGISLQPARKATGTDKPHIERMLGSVATMFAQYVSGYTGRSPEYRGRGTEEKAVWSLPELQDLLDQWLIDLADPAARRAARPAAPGAGVQPEREVRRPDRDRRLRAAGPVARRLHRAASRGLAGRQRLRHQDQPPHLRRQGAEPAAACSIPASPPARACRRSTTTPTTSPGSGSATTANGGWITVFWTQLHRVAAPFGNWPGTTPAS